jgi:tetratricopeptide (TPR) repeat protein
MKDYDAAIANYEKTISLTKDEKIKGDAQESIKYCNNTKAVEFFNKGNDLAKAEKYDEAIASFDQALAISKDYKTYYQKGLSQMKAQKYDDAKISLQQCVAVKDSFSVAHIALANILKAQKDYEGALKSYEKALSVTEEAKKSAIKDAVANTNVLYAKSLSDKKQYDKALEILGKVAAEKGMETTAAYNKGLLYSKKGDNAKAIEQFKISAEDPKYKDNSAKQIKYLQELAKRGKDAKKAK